MSILNFFVPNRQTIFHITSSNPAVVLTTQPHGYNSTLSVRIFFPPTQNFGMSEVMNKLFQITVLTPSSFSIPVDTTPFDPFVVVVAPNGTQQVPQVIPVSEIGQTFSQATMNNSTISPEL